MKRITRVGAIAVLGWVLAIPYLTNAGAESKSHTINVSCSIGPILQVSSVNQRAPDRSEDNTSTAAGAPNGGSTEFTPSIAEGLTTSGSTALVPSEVEGLTTRTELGLQSDGSLIKVRGNVDNIFQQNEIIQNTPRGPVKLYTVTA